MLKAARQLIINNNILLFGSILFLFLMILITIPITQKMQDIRSRAEEIPNDNHPDNTLPSKYKKGEIIFKLKSTIPNFKITKGSDNNFDEKVIDLSELDDNTIPQSLKIIHQKYKISKIEKVFKGTDNPQVNINKYKQQFSKEIFEKKRN